ncbi:L-seryl-tRNA(Sec) selenium transferase [Vibrio xiamenensis]|uniref:L-seryl-tRNA(Sec) selenium transferase n=1 Tax=Vibrio xiamenensis TaxID=861298 RepID=A0A1G8CQL3_9VIBR|nr:L-seryl-tRNA(Sec) selenium transferase [Vibrio xiamenensis]SDH47722.1 L-seryl-tRNA(Sec) selenium transferase [Vibrio xiamenensis]
MSSASTSINYRLPQIEHLLQQSQFDIYIQTLSRPVVRSIMQQTLESIRRRPTFKTCGCEGIDVHALIERQCKKTASDKLQKVINATGTVIHTNLGRSPIDERIWDGVRDVNTGYNNLEIELSTGKRGGRKGILRALLREFVGADNALVVNNNASSLYLLLSELAHGKEVIISRGEQIQIGGGFRIPDILKLTGAVMVEVGTTNITTSQDYLDAITENTAMVLMVHQSNFAIQGFTQAPNIADVAKQLPDHVLLAVDQGSGLTDEGLGHNEPSAAQYLKWGADLVCFSGDKIFGGPQSGIVCGRSDLIERMEKHPMMRTFRPSRIVYSLLEALLVVKLNQDDAGQGVALRAVKNEPLIRQRAEALAARFSNYLYAKSMPLVIGGGTLPTVQYPSYGVAFKPLKRSVEAISRDLRSCPIPIITTIQNGELLCHFATILESDIARLNTQLEGYFASLDADIEADKLNASQSAETKMTTTP